MDYLAFLLCLYISWCLLQALFFLQRWRTHRYPSVEKQPPLPPGPRPLPIIGNLLELSTLPHKSLAELARTHGSIMTLRLGSVTTIVISSASVAREVFRTHDLQLSGRTAPQSVSAYQHDRLSVGWAPVSPLWRTLRRILSNHMFTSKKLDSTRDLRRKKVGDLVGRVENLAREGKSVVLSEEASKTALNFLSSTICSIDFSTLCSDGENDEFVKLIDKFMLQLGKPNLADYFPALRWIDPQGLKRKVAAVFREIFSVLDGLISKKLQQRQESFNSDAPQKSRNPDLLDCLLEICESKSEEIDLHIVKHLILDLLAAGTDTTMSTLEWAVAELLRNPDKLSKAKTELDLEIGRGNQVQESDIAHLPYLQAIVKETLRVHPTVPLLLPRKAEADVVVGGFTIPKGAQILVNAWAIGRDPVSWSDPENFVPERFLGSSDIDLKGQHFEFIPFGAGRRICPGLPLAMKMLQLMLGSLLNCFDWRLEDDMKPEEINLEPKFTITLRMAKPLRLVAVPCMSSF